MSPDLRTHFFYAKLMTNFRSRAEATLLKVSILVFSQFSILATVDWGTFTREANSDCVIPASRLVSITKVAISSLAFSISNAILA